MTTNTDKLTEMFETAINSHTEALDKHMLRLSSPSTIEQLEKVKKILLKNKGRLFMDPINTHSIFLEILKEIRDRYDVAIALIDQQIKNHSEIDIKQPIYPGVSKKLGKWIAGANDSVIGEIIKNNHLPNKADKPIWKGDKADAWRFALAINMTFPKDFNDCFILSDGAKLHGKDKPINQDGKIVNLLKEIMSK